MRNMLILLLLLAATMASADEPAEVSSVRQSSYDWICEDSVGGLISGHTRQDKAFQSCNNAALRFGGEYFVKGGTYRVQATSGSVPPPIDPPPIDPPPIDPPPVDPPSPLVVFGPMIVPNQFPSAMAGIKQSSFRWVITFTVNSLGGSINGLVSRDENGQADPGHLSVWIESNGTIRVRYQDIDGGRPNLVLDSSTTVVPGVQYVATVSVEPGIGTALFVNGSLEASAAWAIGIDGNDLPLTVGATCTKCNDAATPPVSYGRFIDGIVMLEIFDEPLDIPVPISGSAVLDWILPTDYYDCVPGVPDADQPACGEPLEPGLPDKVSVYRVNGPAGGDPRVRLADLAGDAVRYEVNDLPGGEHCFAVTAWALKGESDESNVSCKLIR